MARIETYPVCPYFAEQNVSREKTTIKCSCLTETTDELILRFKGASPKKSHMVDFCRNMDGYKKCPLFETIFWMEGMKYGD